MDKKVFFTLSSFSFCLLCLINLFTFIISVPFLFSLFFGNWMKPFFLQRKIFKCFLFSRKFPEKMLHRKIISEFSNFNFAATVFTIHKLIKTYNKFAITIQWMKLNFMECLHVSWNWRSCVILMQSFFIFACAPTTIIFHRKKKNDKNKQYEASPSSYK